MSKSASAATCELVYQAAERYDIRYGVARFMFPSIISDWHICETLIHAAVSCIPDNAVSWRVKPHNYNTLGFVGMRKQIIQRIAEKAVVRIEDAERAYVSALGKEDIREMIIREYGTYLESGDA